MENMEVAYTGAGNGRGLPTLSRAATNEYNRVFDQTASNQRAAAAARTYENLTPQQRRARRLRERADRR